MLVIADTSPIVALVNIGHAHVLADLFGCVIIPPTVAAELARDSRPRGVREFISSPPAWLSVRPARHIADIPGIHQGEREAISLVQELGADLLIIDDREGRRAALKRNIPTIRTLALIEQAAIAGLLDLGEAIEALRGTDFRVPELVVEQMLARHRGRRGEADR